MSEENSHIFCCDWWQNGDTDECKMEKDTKFFFFNQVEFLQV